MKKTVKKTSALRKKYKNKQNLFYSKAQRNKSNSFTSFIDL